MVLDLMSFMEEESKFPSSHSLIRCFRQRMRSFDVLCGFCSKRTGIIMAHFRAIVSRVDP